VGADVGKLTVMTRMRQGDLLVFALRSIMLTVDVSGSWAQAAERLRRRS
jgi:hypothetical protein